MRLLFSFDLDSMFLDATMGIACALSLGFTLGRSPNSGVASLRSTTAFFPFTLTTGFDCPTSFCFDAERDRSTKLALEPLSAFDRLDEFLGSPLWLPLFLPALSRSLDFCCGVLSLLTASPLFCLPTPDWFSDSSALALVAVSFVAPMISRLLSTNLPVNNRRELSPLSMLIASRSNTSPPMVTGVSSTLLILREGSLSSKSTLLLIITASMLGSL